MVRFETCLLRSNLKWQNTVMASSTQNNGYQSYYIQTLGT